MARKYFGNFTDAESINSNFSGYYGEMEHFVEPNEVILATYDTGNWEGYAFVLFERDGQLYEVVGGHCSCYGLEGQWEPEATSIEALDMRKFSNYYYSQAFRTRIKNWIKNRKEQEA